MTTDIDRLIKHLQKQTIAMQQLTDAINNLAGTNLDLVETVAEQNLAERDEEGGTGYLDPDDED